MELTITRVESVEAVIDTVGSPYLYVVLKSNYGDKLRIRLYKSDLEEIANAVKAVLEVNDEEI